MEATRNSKLNWSADTFSIVQQDNYHFGLNDRQIEELVSLLISKGFNLPSGEEIGFTLHHVKATVACLKESGVYEANFKIAVEKLLEASQPEEEPGQEQAPNDEYNQQPEHDEPATEVENQKVQQAPGTPTTIPATAIQEAQAALRSLMSPQPPFNVMIDGRWGPQTDNAFQMVMRYYNLPVEASFYAVELLKSIAARVVRIRCKSESIIKLVKHNPFCIIHNDGNEFELTSKGTLRSISNKRELVRFNSMPGRHETAALAFNAFSAWFMLLNMKGSRESGSPVVNAVNEENDIENLPNWFVIQPQMVLRYNPGDARVQLKFHVGKEEECIAVLLSRSMAIKILPQVSINREDETGEVIIGDFFSEVLKGNRLEVSIDSEADFMKFFIVKKDWVKHVQAETIINPEGVELNKDFYNLITASKESILRTTLVGMIAENFNASSESFEKHVEKIYDAREITVEDDLQKNRWGGKYENNGIIIKAGAKQSLVPWNYNVTVTVESSIKGKRLEGKIAFFLHNTFSKEIRYETVVKGKAVISFKAYEAFTIGAYTEDGTMLELDLNEVQGLPKGFYYRDVANSFKREVQSLYKSRPVTVKKDLQKNRWGGKSINGGKVLEAEVVKSRLPSNYKVTIRLRSENSSRPLTGDVAFFMHDTFTEIKYRKAVNGEAKVVVYAYEDFTVGAYTEDGVMLELDLNTVKGLPEGFYYKPKEE